MRVAAPLIDQLTQLASQHPDPAVDRVWSPSPPCRSADRVRGWAVPCRV